MGLFTKSKMEEKARGSSRLQPQLDVAKCDIKIRNSSFEFVIRDCFTVDKTCVVVGSVKRGRVDPGDILVLSNGDTCLVQSIEGERKSLLFATAGSGSVGMFLEGVEASVMRKEKVLYKA